MNTAARFALAVKDHDQAVTLDPGSAEVYFSRGRTYYDRAALEDGKEAKPWFDPAAADFKKAVERDGRHYMALDMLGLVHEQTGELDQAIGDFTQEMALDATRQGEARRRLLCPRVLQPQREEVRCRHRGLREGDRDRRDRRRLLVRSLSIRWPRSTTA